CLLLTFLAVFFFFLLIWRPPLSTLFPYTTLFRSVFHRDGAWSSCRRVAFQSGRRLLVWGAGRSNSLSPVASVARQDGTRRMARSDRKSTRLNSSHVKISYAVFCLKKKKRIGLHSD